MESYYEFNVSYEGHHLFATSPHSCPNCCKMKAENLYKELCARFPESEGWSVTVTEWDHVGYSRTLEFCKSVKRD